MGATVFERLEARLTEASAPYKVTRHAPVYTSEEAAAVRGVALCSGAKALVVKAGENFVLLVVPADRKLDSKKARDGLGVKSMRFATPDEVLTLTGLKPGSIPPFGGLFGLPTYCDPALAQNETINFNAGDHAISMALKHADYLTVERPTMAVLT